jgi:hypothetical protein
MSLYVYVWKNNQKRAQLYDRQCVVLVRGAMNSCLVEFVDNGQREIVSRWAIRKSTTSCGSGLAEKLGERDA